MQKKVGSIFIEPTKDCEINKVNSGKEANRDA